MGRFGWRAENVKLKCVSILVQERRWNRIIHWHSSVGFPKFYHLKSSWQITNIEYWYANSFSKINEVLMPLTTYASTLILTGPSGVWKYKSISAFPEMNAFPVTWTKLSCCPCWILMGVCISESDFCKIRVMSDPESIITLVRFLSRKLTVAGTWVAWEPRKEHPGGRAWCFFNSTSGLELVELLEIEWWILAISQVTSLWVFQFKEIFGVVDKSLLEKVGSRARSTLKELVSDKFEFKGWVISAPKGRLIPSVPSRLDVSSNDSELGLLSWLGRSECWRGLQKSCWLVPSSESDSNS